MKKIKNSKKKIQKKENRIYSNFIFSLKYIKEIRNYIFFSIILFFLVILFGFLFPIFFRAEIIDYLQKIMKETIGLSMLDLIGFIITNNIQSAFMGMILGIFFGIGPLSIIIVNAYVLGFVANGVVGSAGFFVLWKLFPHGIFEIPAILISVSLGLKIGISLITDFILFYNKKIGKLMMFLMIALSIVLFLIAFPIIIVLTLFNEKLRVKLFNNIKKGFIVFIFVVVPLLVIAGIIEGSLIYLLV